MGTSANLPYHSPTPGEISIIAKTPYRYDRKITREVYEEVIDCGFNMAFLADNVTNIKTCFDVAKDLDLRFLITKGSIDDTEYLKLVREYKDNPLLGGYELKDEPQFNELPSLKDISDKILGIDDSHLIDINIACDLSTTEMEIYFGPNNGLSEYLNYFQQLFTPAFWSYDYYPIKEINGVVQSNDSGFFYNMQLFFEQSKKTDRPFWAYCMCMPYDYTTFSRPDPTLGQLSFEAFSALAYGAQGIVYWAYAQREPEGNLVFTSAPIDKEGNKTAIWYRVQNINKQIRSYNDVFCGCEVINVMHAGKNYPATTPFSPEVFGYFKKIETMDMGVLVSHIKNNNRNYIVIVNHDPLHTQKISMTFQEEIQSRIYELPEFIKPDFKPDGTHSRTLGPGGYVIFRVL